MLRREEAGMHHQKSKQHFAHMKADFRVGMIKKELTKTFSRRVLNFCFDQKIIDDNDETSARAVLRSFMRSLAQEAQYDHESWCFYRKTSKPNNTTSYA